MKQCIRAATLLVWVLGVAGCDLVSPGDKLTEQEAEELALAIAQAGLLTAPTFSPQQGPALEAARVTITVNETESCEGGGTSAIAGSATVDVNEQTGSGTASFTYTVTPTNCGVRTASGKVFRLTGDPNLKVTGEFSFTQTSFSGTIDYQGSFKWQSDDGRSGGCSLTLKAQYQVTVGQTSATSSVSVKGQVCGRDVSRNATFTVSG
jgi:hypothetical protein